MARLRVDIDQDQEFAESILFSAAIADEFGHLKREYNRSWSDIIEVCLRREIQVRQRLKARGVDWLRCQSTLLLSWCFCLEEAVAALEHIESDLGQRELDTLNAGRRLLAGLPVALLRWQFDEPFECAVCEDFSLTHSSGLPLPSPEQLEAIMAEPGQAALVKGR